MDSTTLFKNLLELGRSLERLTLKKNAYKRDYQRTKQCLDAALDFQGFCIEKAFRKESLYTLWLEEKAHQRNLELARDRERLAGSWLLESENLYAHLVRRFFVCSFCKRKYIIAHLYDTLDLPHREREDYAFCDTCEKGACRKCEDQEICQRVSFNVMHVVVDGVKL